MPSEVNPNRKIVYADVSLKGMNLETASKYKEAALPTIARLLSGFTLHQPNGEKVSVAVKVDDLSIEKDTFRGAWAGPVSASSYQIIFGAGLIAQLSVVARGIAADKKLLRGRTNSVLLRKDVRGEGREKALGDFVFHFMVMFIVWHEVAHIALGHIDWLKKGTGLGVIDEFNYAPMPDNKYARRQTLEADADRQAATWSAAFIDEAIRRNPYLRYKTQFDLFYDVGFIYGALFGLLDAVDPRTMPNDCRRHPKANVRLGIALAFVRQYLEKSFPETVDRFHQQVISGGLDALSIMLHSEKQALDVFEIYAFMTETGRNIEKLGIRSFGHKISYQDSGSFELM